MQGPRERMVVSAALLIRERGAHATAISDVLQHSGAPRGRPITTSRAVVPNCYARPSITPESMSPP
ncbi:HTH-type transcriptional regulator [Mycobacterium tuberculosis]|nr:HTH-type transcriptional regulator [Mycobacterium tuberculosis]